MNPIQQSPSTPDIDHLSSKELAELIERASGKLSEKREQEKAAVKAELIALAKERGFNIAELFGTEKAKTPRNKVEPKYRDPEDPGNTWTGRGRKPKWLVVALGGGKRIEDFKI